MPGDDSFESARIVVGECSLPALPELPSRGPGSDLVGRTAGLLEGFTVSAVPSGWQLTDHPGIDHRRAVSWLGQDLDAFEQACLTHQGWAKVQVCGPWTLAARIERASGQALLRDHGARRDLVTALEHAVTLHVRDVQRRLPAGVELLVQVDEPMVDQVLLGRVPTASGWATYRSVDKAEVRSGLSAVVEAIRSAGATPIVHSCSDEPPLELFLEAGFAGLSFDQRVLAPSNVDLLAEAVENGVVLIPGVIGIEDAPASTNLTKGGRSEPPMSEVLSTVSGVQRWWSAMGFTDRSPADNLALSPTCGLAGASPARVRVVLSRLQQMMTVLREDPDGDHATQ